MYKVSVGNRRTMQNSCGKIQTWYFSLELETREGGMYIACLTSVNQAWIIRSNVFINHRYQTKAIWVSSPAHLKLGRWSHDRSTPCLIPYLVLTTIYYFGHWSDLVVTEFLNALSFPCFEICLFRPYFY